MNQHITVLMSTYNGEKFLREQLDSIFKQKNVDVRLVVRDDCSTDSTVKILDEYKENYPSMIIENGEQNLGPCKSFFYLINKYNDDKYFALADQDDVWDEDKLAIAIEKIEAIKDDEKPLLYYSNLNIVNSNGVFCRLSHSTPHTAKSVYSALMENLATGCTIVYNKCLADIAYEIKPYNYSMHDAWLYLVAKIFGKTIYDFTPHINYRQHEKNQVGTYKRKVDKKKILQEIKIIVGSNGKIWSKNAEIFYSQFEKKLQEKDKIKIQKFINYNKNKINVIFDRDFYSRSFYRTMRFIVEALFNTL